MNESNRIPNKAPRIPSTYPFDFLMTDTTPKTTAPIIEIMQ